MLTPALNEYDRASDSAAAVLPYAYQPGTGVQAVLQAVGDYDVHD